MRCQTCSIAITEDNKNHCCYNLNANKYSIGILQKEDIIGTIDWVNTWDNGNQTFSGIILEGISYPWYGRYETWTRNLFLIERNRYITKSIDWLHIGDTVYMQRLTTSWGEEYWHATLIVSEDIIEAAREEMLDCLVLKYKRMIQKAEERLAHYKSKLKELID